MRSSYRSDDQRTANNIHLPKECETEQADPKLETGELPVSWFSMLTTFTICLLICAMNVSTSLGQQ